MRRSARRRYKATLAAVAAFTESRQRVRAAATWVAVLELLDLEGDERTDDEDSGPTARLQAVSAGEYASKSGVSRSHLQRSEAVSPTLPCSSRVFLTLGRRVIGEGWFPNAEVDVVGRPRIPVTLSKVSNFTQYFLNFDSGVDSTAVDTNDCSVATAATEGYCTNLLPAARATVYLYLYRARTLDQQPRAFDRAIL